MYSSSVCGYFNHGDTEKTRSALSLKQVASNILLFYLFFSAHSAPSPYLCG